GRGTARRPVALAHEDGTGDRRFGPRGSASAPESSGDSVGRLPDRCGGRVAKRTRPELGTRRSIAGSTRRSRPATPERGTGRISERAAPPGGRRNRNRVCRGEVVAGRPEWILAGSSAARGYAGRAGR